MSDDKEAKYRSRKFLVTVGGTLLGAALAMVEKLTPGMANIIAAAIGSYNLANAWINRG